MRFKAILIAAAMVLAAVSGASANNEFPDISSIFLNHGGVLTPVSGTVNKMNVTFVNRSSNVLFTTTLTDTGGTDNGRLFQSSSSKFWQFADTIVFSSAAFDTTSRLDIDGFLVPSANGKNAAGPAAFQYTAPAGSPRTGQQLVIEGAVKVTMVNNKQGTKAAIKALNFQPSRARIRNFRNTTTLDEEIRGDAKLVLPAMTKIFGVSSTIP